MSKKRKQYNASFKSKIALAALKRDETTSEIAARFQHPTMVSTWKRELLNNAPELFEGKEVHLTLTQRRHNLKTHIS